jgi:hypothetical protein
MDINLPLHQALLWFLFISIRVLQTPLPCIGNRHRVQEFDLESPAINEQPINDVEPRTAGMNEAPENRMINNPRKNHCHHTADTNTTTCI